LTNDDDEDGSIKQPNAGSMKIVPPVE
jgi:hypothetical protein